MAGYDGNITLDHVESYLLQIRKDSPHKEVVEWDSCCLPDSTNPCAVVNVS